MSWLPLFSGPGPKRVGGIGDSFMALSAPSLASRYELAPWSWATASQPGAPAHGIEEAGWPSALAAAEVDVAVVMAGTNDVEVLDVYWDAGYGAAAFYTQAAIIGHFPVTTLVVWVNIFEGITQLFPDADVSGHAAGYNAGLEFWATQYEQLQVVDWNAAVTWCRGAYGLDLLGADGVHPTSVGLEVLSQMVADTIGGDQ
jgi:lysophospholipase L1-like esterase